MKKRIMIPAAIAALMGVGGYLAHRAIATTPTDGLSELELANAEALADDPEIDLPGVSILCTAGKFGICHEKNPLHDLDPREHPCRVTGYPDDYCPAL